VPRWLNENSFLLVGNDNTLWYNGSIDSTPTERKVMKKLFQVKCQVSIEVDGDSIPVDQFRKAAFMAIEGDLPENIYREYEYVTGESVLELQVKKITLSPIKTFR
jgi:hypothetical protein